MAWMYVAPFKSDLPAFVLVCEVVTAVQLQCVKHGGYSGFKMI